MCGAVMTQRNPLMANHVDGQALYRRLKLLREKLARSRNSEIHETLTEMDEILNLIEEVLS